VHITITTTCTASGVNSGCYMSFTASGGASLAGADTRAAGALAAQLTAPTFAGSASFVVTTTGNTTFTGVYRSTSATATFSASTIIVQVY
jgi:hypothetical protein